VNDATGLIAYRYAIAFVATGAFGVWSAGLQFLIVALGGVVIGLATGYAFKKIHQFTPDNPTVDTTFTFLAPYVAYLSAEWFHLSGVLAVVVAGLFMSRSSSTVFSQQGRLNAYGSWNTVIFVLNGIIFILIGLQLPSILEGIQDRSFWTLFYYGAVVSVAVIVVRLIWVYPGSYIPRWLSKKIREREPEPDIRHVTVVGWSGMRGVVSLAAALALPFTLEGTGEPFPNRELIIFLTFSVIFSTLVIQGLTLRPLIRILGITSDGIEAREEMEARLLLASSVIEHIEENYALGLSEEVLNQIKTKYEIRIQRIRKDQEQRKLDEGQINEFHRIQQELLDKERNVILSLRSKGKVSDEVMRKIEYELDLEETRLILERGAA
jgi:CPA1 family monovalent cation:H+ antiporter